MEKRNQVAKIQLKLKNYAFQRLEFFEMEFDELLSESLQSDSDGHKDKLNKIV